MSSRLPGRNYSLYEWAESFPFLFHPLQIEEIIVDPIFLRCRMGSMKKVCWGPGVMFLQRWFLQTSTQTSTGCTPWAFLVAGKSFCCTILLFLLIIFSTYQPIRISRSWLRGTLLLIVTIYCALILYHLLNIFFHVIQQSSEAEVAS